MKNALSACALIVVTRRPAGWMSCGDADASSPHSFEGGAARSSATTRSVTSASWTDTLHMNEVIESAVDPTTALSVGPSRWTPEVLPAGLLQSADLAHAPPPRSR